MKISKVCLLAAGPGVLWAGVAVHVAGALDVEIGDRPFEALLVAAAVATLAVAVMAAAMVAVHHYQRSTREQAHAAAEQTQAVTDLANALRSHTLTEARWEERMYRGGARAYLDAAQHNTSLHTPPPQGWLPADTGPFSAFRGGN